MVLISIYTHSQTVDHSSQIPQYFNPVDANSTNETGLPLNNAMDSHEAFPYTWDNPGPPYNQQIHGPYVEPTNRQLAGPSNFEESYQTPSQAIPKEDLQPDHDIHMMGNDVEARPATPEVRERQRSRRAKYEKLDWNGYKAAIEIYIWIRTKACLKLRTR